MQYVVRESRSTITLRGIGEVIALSISNGITRILTLIVVRAHHFLPILVNVPPINNIAKGKRIVDEVTARSTIKPGLR